MNLYHYTSLDTLYKILGNQTFRLTRMKMLNDTTEYSFGINLLKSKVREYEVTHHIINKIDLSMFDRFMFRDELFSASFTEEKDSVIFWNSSYVPPNEGISIEIDKDCIFDDRLILNKCIYGDPYPKMDVQTYNWFKSLFDNPILLHKNLNFIKITFQTGLIKNQSFKVENEWRAVTFPLSKVNTFLKRGKQCDYFDYPLRRKGIKSIIVGPSNKQIENLHNLNDFLVESNWNINIYKSNIPLSL